MTLPPELRLGFRVEIETWESGGGQKGGEKEAGWVNGGGDQTGGQHLVPQSADTAINGQKGKLTPTTGTATKKTASRKWFRERLLPNDC